VDEALSQIPAFQATCSVGIFLDLLSEFLLRVV
jgi:hypothetical protein